MALYSKIRCHHGEAYSCAGLCASAPKLARKSALGSLLKWLRIYSNQFRMQKLALDVRSLQLGKFFKISRQLTMPTGCMLRFTIGMQEMLCVLNSRIASSTVASSVKQIGLRLII